MDVNFRVHTFDVYAALLEFYIMGCSSMPALQSCTSLLHLSNKSILSYPLFDLGVLAYPVIAFAELAPESCHSEFVRLVLVSTCVHASG